MRKSKAGFSIVEVLAAISVLMLSFFLTSTIVKTINHKKETGYFSVQQLPIPRYTVDSLQIKDFGHKVHFFQQAGNNFGEKLVLFLESHTNLEVSAIAGEVVYRNCYPNGPAGAYGETIGYFVTFREKK